MSQNYTYILGKKIKMKTFILFIDDLFIENLFDNLFICVFLPKSWLLRFNNNLTAFSLHSWLSCVLQLVFSIVPGNYSISGDLKTDPVRQGAGTLQNWTKSLQPSAKLLLTFDLPEEVKGAFLFYCNCADALLASIVGYCWSSTSIAMT